jgi:transposase
VWGGAETYEQLQEENLRLRQPREDSRSLHAQVMAQLREAEASIRALKEKLAEMARRLFGRKSEKSQTARAAPSPQDPGKKPRGQPRGRPGHGRQQRPDLPEQKLRVDLPGGAPLCGQCGQADRANGTARSSGEIVWEVRLFRRWVVCQQYEQACSCPKPGLPARVVAPPPARLIERGLLSGESIVEGWLRKFLYFMPVARLIAEWRQLGVAVSPGTWCGIFQRMGPLFEPLVGRWLEACRADGQWLMDETRWEVFVEVEGKGSSRWWWWVVVSPRVKFYILSPSRGSGVPKDFFG